LLEPELDEPEELEAPADPAEPELLSPPAPPDLPVAELAAWPLLASTLPVLETLSFLAKCFFAFFAFVAWVVVSVDDAVGLLSASFIAMVDDFALSLALYPSVVPELVDAGSEALASVDDDATVLDAVVLGDAVDGVLAELLVGAVCDGIEVVLLAVVLFFALW
jgi:hypothetical protein